MGENINLALQCNADLLVLDDNAFALLWIAKEFNGYAADLIELMTARAVKWKLTFATFGIGCVGLTALPLIKIFFVKSGLGE